MRIPNRFPNRPNRNLTTHRLGGSVGRVRLREVPNHYYHFIPYTPPSGAHAHARAHAHGRGGVSVKNW